MNFKIILKKKAFVKRKLKKKSRFWRLFKKFFLKKKRKTSFYRLNWLINHKRIMWHQLTSVYGKKIKNILYSGHTNKKIFNTKFDNVLRKLELRLCVLLVRINLVRNLVIAQEYIKDSKIVVNGKKKHPNYQIRLQDLIVKNNSKSSSKFLLPNSKINKWKRWYYRWKWRRVKAKFKNRSKIRVLKQRFKRLRRTRMYWLVKKNMVFNFLEINYSIWASILIRYPLLGEILHKNKKRFLFSGLLRKVYLLY